MSIQTFLATTGQGLARASQHASGEWQVECFLAGQDVRCLAAHRTHPEVVYAGTQGNGVLRSSDGGRTWSAAGLEGQVVKALAVSPTFPDTVYAGTKPARLFVSRDAGAIGRNLHRSATSLDAGSGSHRQRSPSAPMCRRLRSHRPIKRQSWWGLKREQW